MDILTEKNLSSILLANMDLTYWSVYSSSRIGGYGIKGVEVGIVILASCEYNFIRVHENLAQYPSNNILIVIYQIKYEKCLPVGWMDGWKMGTVFAYPMVHQSFHLFNSLFFPFIAFPHFFFFLTTFDPIKCVKLYTGQ